MTNTDAPVVTCHDGVFVVREDLRPGGTKTRYLRDACRGMDEVVYASAPEGGAQTALAVVARDLGVCVTIFVARRTQPHARTQQARALGARICEVSPGYLSVVRARARDYSRQSGAHLLPFGLAIPGAQDAVAEAARMTDLQPDEVWCAGGSGLVARGLARAWPTAVRHVVQVGHALSRDEVAGAHIHPTPYRFSDAARRPPPFPSDPHYDAKAWEVCRTRHGSGCVVFWNVAGPATVNAARCPHCGEDRLIERVGPSWFCNVCGKSWRATPDGVAG